MFGIVNTVSREVSHWVIYIYTYTYRYVRAEINFGRTQRYLQLFQPVHSGIYLLFDFALFFNFLNQHIIVYYLKRIRRSFLRQLGVLDQNFNY